MAQISNIICYQPNEMDISSQIEMPRKRERYLDHLDLELRDHTEFQQFAKANHFDLDHLTYQVLRTKNDQYEIRFMKDPSDIGIIYSVPPEKTELHSLCKQFFEEPSSQPKYPQIRTPAFGKTNHKSHLPSLIQKIQILKRRIRTLEAQLVKQPLPQKNAQETQAQLETNEEQKLKSQFAELEQQHQRLRQETAETAARMDLFQQGLSERENILIQFAKQTSPQKQDAQTQSPRESQTAMTQTDSETQKPSQTELQAQFQQDLEKLIQREAVERNGNSELIEQAKTELFKTLNEDWKIYSLTPSNQTSRPQTQKHTKDDLEKDELLRRRKITIEENFARIEFIKNLLETVSLERKKSSEQEQVFFEVASEFEELLQEENLARASIQSMMPHIKTKDESTNTELLTTASKNSMTEFFSAQSTPEFFTPKSHTPENESPRNESPRTETEGISEISSPRVTEEATLCYSYLNDLLQKLPTNERKKLTDIFKRDWIIANIENISFDSFDHLKVTFNPELPKQYRPFSAKYDRTVTILPELKPQPEALFRYLSETSKGIFHHARTLLQNEQSRAIANILNSPKERFPAFNSFAQTLTSLSSKAASDSTATYKMHQTSLNTAVALFCAITGRSDLAEKIIDQYNFNGSKFVAEHLLIERGLKVQQSCFVSDQTLIRILRNQSKSTNNPTTQFIDIYDPVVRQTLALFNSRPQTAAAVSKSN